MGGNVELNHSVAVGKLMVYFGLVGDSRRSLRARLSHLTRMHLRRTTILIFAGLIALASCGTRESDEERHREANTPAGKVGQAAHKVALEADQAGRVIGHKLDKAAHNAHEGWNEAARKDHDKK
jgi:hypothetical protein